MRIDWKGRRHGQQIWTKAGCSAEQNAPSADCKAGESPVQAILANRRKPSSLRVSALMCYALNAPVSDLGGYAKDCRRLTSEDTARGRENAPRSIQGVTSV